MSSERKKFVDDCISEINKYRNNHQVSPLKKNSDLCNVAQKWADNLAASNVLSHSKSTYKGEPLGENCFMNWTSSGRTLTADEAIDSWYSEIKNYNFRTNSGSKTGHFTQIVWKDSREIGIGQAQSRDGKSCVVVANFYPAGNYVGHNAENVLPPVGGTSARPATESRPENESRQVLQDSKESKPGFFASMLNRKPSPDQPTTQITVRTQSPRTAEWTTPTATSYTRTVESTSSTRGQYTQESYNSSSGKVVRTVTSETVVGPDGKSKTVTKETVTSQGSPRDISREFRQLRTGPR